MANVFTCDRCLKLVTLKPTGTGDVRPLVSLRMPHNPANGRSEGLDFAVCADCYDLTRQFFGLDALPELTDGWRDREVRRRGNLPTLNFQPALPDVGADESNDTSDD